VAAGAQGVDLMVADRDDFEPFEKLAERLATRIMELANTADDRVRAEGTREIFAADYILHSGSGGTVVGVDAYIERIATNLSGLPGMHFEMDDLVAQRDRFALRYHWTAPHGDGEIGNEALEINRVADGRVVETWNYQDRFSLLVELGVIDDPFAPI
jgi:predicted ester cyclase